MTCTTKFSEVRPSLMCAIEELIPERNCDVNFRSALDEIEFGLWAQQNPGASLRRFTIINNLDLIPAFVTSTSGLDTEQTFTVRVAYPTQMGIYGINNYRDLEDCMECDQHQIDLAIGLLGFQNWPDGVHKIQLSTSNRDDFEEVVILNTTYNFQFRRRGITS